MDKKWLSYWKKSLSDSLKADINLDKLKYFEIERFNEFDSFLADSGNVNKLIDFEENRINRKKGITERKSENWVFLESATVLIAPFKIVPVPENPVYLKDKKSKFPFWYYAILNRNGNLSVPEELFPIFQRKYLEPIADENTEYVFTSVENVDKAAGTGKEEYRDYKDYINYLRTVFQLAVNQEPEHYTCAGYETVFNGIVLLPDEEINAATGIISLYEKILNEKHIPELLKSFININNCVGKTPLDVAEFIHANSLHLGQMGYSFPLSISQRKSLLTFLNSTSKVFAVNGPPGTGKTTLLQSIVANKMVESAIAGNDAPIILACSTNNQAVTNIIDSFSKSDTKDGSLKGRWLPGIEGYATYLPSSSKTEAELEGVNYKKLKGEGLFNRVENQEYLNKAKDYFLQESSKYFFSSRLFSIQEIVAKLQDELRSVQATLQEASQKWCRYLDAEKLLEDSFLNEKSADACYSGDLINEQMLDKDIVNLTKLEESIIEYFNKEPFFRRLFCFLGINSALKNRAAEIRIKLRDSLIRETPDFTFTKSHILELTDKKIGVAKTIKKAAAEWKLWKKKHAVNGNPPRTESQYWDCEYLKLRTQPVPNCFYDELDVVLRHKAFQLALHYWEGRWILQLEKDLNSDQFDKKGLSAVENRWKRQAMLTPCFVSTFYMAPKFFCAYKFLLKGEDGKNIFDEPPLFGFIDTLIVDESGQVSPEVGVATFSLAKQAIVVGDVKQIEPVWNIIPKIDIGNLKKEGLIKDYNDPVYEKVFDPKGFLSSSGSIMKMAQNACEFKEAGLNENGVLLVEHRRCFDEIINYCNELAYNGQLKPLKGKAKNLLFPPMYCIHVEGNSTVTRTSRYNQFEVNAIVDWLCENKAKIEAKYRNNKMKTIEDMVGIITPFVGQKNSLKTALKNAGFNVNVLKLGTVHALQGAERPIILFSTVYGKGDSATMFFDRDNKPNMLNVAVSRAQDNFIVFANTGILDKKAKTPSGILANHLAYE
jgi:predicted ATPase